MAGPTDDTLPTSDAEREAMASLHSLRRLLVLCVLGPVLLFAAFAAYRYEKVHEEAQVRIDRALQIAREHALKVLETNELVLASALEAAQSLDRAALHRQLQALSRDKPQVQSIWVIAADGSPIATDRYAALAPGLNFADREFFRWHQGQAQPGKLYFSGLLMGKVTKTRFFDMSRALRDAQGRFAGTVSVSISPEYFLKFHEALSIDEPGLSLAMFNQDGALYARWPRVDKPMDRLADGSAVLEAVRKGQRSGVLMAQSGIDGSKRLAMFTRLGEYPVYVGTSMQQSAIVLAWAREMGLIAALAAMPALGLLVAGFGAMRRARQTVAAARRLHEEMEARRHVEEALRQSQKMEAMGRLTGGVAHDFNNALMVISANLHMLQVKHPQVAGRQTEAMGRAVSGATNLTRQLLAFSRRQALLPQVVSLQEKLPSLKDMLAPLLGSQVALTIEVDVGTPPIQVDVAELELALINLAVNAKDAMQAGGRFGLRARQVTAPAPMQGQAVVIEAIDTGAGIPADIAARVFEPFFTTKAVGQGTGLGLSQVYGLCQRSGGTAEVHSKPGYGTTVAMYFPPSEVAASSEQPDEELAVSQLDLRVVLVEDNADVAQAVRPILESLGCEVTHFSNATEAMRWVDGHADEADLVLTDVVMPGEVDGLDLAQYVRRAYPELGLVVMTGYAQQLEAITREGFTVLPKPWTAGNLARALKSVAPGRVSA